MDHIAQYMDLVAFYFFLLFIVIISGLYFIYNVFKTGKISFEEFFKNVVFNIIEEMIIYLTLVIGTSLLLLLFSFLIYEVSNVFFRLEILLFGLYLIMIFWKNKEEAVVFVWICIKNNIGYKYYKGVQINA